MITDVIVRSITGVIAMRISSAEAVVMEALWRKSPVSADEIVTDIGRQQDWSDKTVKTLINRLLTKKAIAATRDGRRYIYTPLIQRSAYVQNESRSLLDRLFDGRLAPLVSHFAETRQLSKDDVTELKRLVRKLDNGK
jgi:BlaI family transcriptional regulator, penicillinase repressor